MPAGAARTRLHASDLLPQPPLSNSTTSFPNKSRRGTCHTPPSRCADPPLVIITGTIDAFKFASCSISTTGIPTPVASATTSHLANSGSEVTSRTYRTTSRYRVPSGSRSNRTTRNRSNVGCIHRK